MKNAKKQWQETTLKTREFFENERITAIFLQEITYIIEKVLHI